jgi:hypothetical protein
MKSSLRKSKESQLIATISTRDRYLSWSSCTVAFALFVLHAPLAGAYDWEIETVDTAWNEGFNNSMVLDVSDYPHISYDKPDWVMYAYCNTSGWHTETVDYTFDMDFVGGHSSLALEGLGNPHICYCVSFATPNPSAGFKCAWKDTEGWQYDAVFQNHDAVWHPSLALDADGYRHMAYGCDIEGIPGFGGLAYCYEDASGWHRELVDSCNAETATPSLALDGEGYPHIGYLKDEGLWYAYKDISGWQIQVVDDWYTLPGIGLELDIDGYPHIGYETGGSIMYAYKDVSGWHIEMSWWAGGSSGVSFALDSDKNPHLVDSGGSGGGHLNYYWKDETGWHMDQPDEPSGSFSLALDTYGVPHISYHSGDSDLKYATPTIILSGTVQGGGLLLNWSELPWGGGFRLYGEENNPYFEPTPQNLIALTPDNFRYIPNCIGDPQSNWTYLVIGVTYQLQEIMRSNYFGEQDFGMEIP